MMHENQGPLLTGNILLFYAFDVGDEIDLSVIRDKELLPVRSVALSPYFKNYHIPLSFHLPRGDVASGQDTDCIISKVHHCGALSFCYRVPFRGTIDQLKHLLINMHEEYAATAERDARMIYEKILRTIRKARFYHLKNSYYIVQVDPLEGLSVQDFKDQYGTEIAALLRLETQELAQYQKQAILSSSMEYFGHDVIIIDSEASFIYDNEYFVVLEFFEFTNIQLLELQFFDWMLYERLNFFYSQEAMSIPWRAYVPLVQNWLNLPVIQLAKLRVDISVISEQLENSIKMTGDAFYIQLYLVLVDKLRIRSWKESIEKKLDIIEDLYSLYEDRLRGIREEMLTVVIILLIALEAFAAFMR